MKTCRQCQAKNKDQAIFCEKCGSSMEGILSEPDNKKTPWLKRMILIFMAAAVLYFVITSIIFANPSYKLLNGLAGLAKMKKMTVTTTVNVNYKGDTSELNILDDITAKTKTGLDLNNLLVESSVELLFKNKPVTKIVGGVNNQAVYADLLKLYDKKFVYELDSDVQDRIKEAKVVLKALHKVNLKFNTQKYAQIFEEVMDDKISKKGNEITVEMDSETAAELMKAILEEAVDDKDLMESVRKSGLSFTKELLKNKDDLSMIEDEEVEELQETLNDKDEFEESYEQALTQLIDDLAYQLDNNYLKDIEQEIEMTFKFDLFNNINGLKYTLEMEDYSGQYTVDLDMNIQNGASFTKVNPNSALPIEDIVQDSDVSEKIVENLIKAVKSNKELVNELEDLTGQDIEDLDEYVLEYISY